MQQGARVTDVTRAHGQTLPAPTHPRCTMHDARCKEGPCSPYRSLDGLTQAHFPVWPGSFRLMHRPLGVRTAGDGMRRLLTAQRTLVRMLFRVPRLHVRPPCVRRRTHVVTEDSGGCRGPVSGLSTADGLIQGAFSTHGVSTHNAGRWMVPVCSAARVLLYVLHQACLALVARPRGCATCVLYLGVAVQVQPLAFATLRCT